MCWPCRSHWLAPAIGLHSQSPSAASSRSGHWRRRNGYAARGIPGKSFTPLPSTGSRRATSAYRSAQMPAPPPAAPAPKRPTSGSRLGRSSCAASA
jgi:hypothetical protein